MLCFGLPSSNRGLWGSSPFLFIILLIFSDDLEKKLLCGFKLLSISRFLATFPVCSSCCKSSSMLISKTLVSLLKHTLAWESLHSFLYIFLQKYHQLIVRTDICQKRFLLSFFNGFVRKTAFILTSPIKFNGSVTDQSHAQDNSAVTLSGLNHIQDGGRIDKLKYIKWTSIERQTFSKQHCNEWSLESRTCNWASIRNFIRSSKLSSNNNGYTRAYSTHSRPCAN